MYLIEKFQKYRLIQCIAAATATLTAASAGMYSTWPSPSLPKLTSSNSPIGTTITDNEGSWVASVFVLSMAPFAPLIGIIVAKFGPKRTLLFSAVPTFTGWIMCVFAESAATLIAARLIGGLGGAIAIAVVPMYIGEISSKDIRGRLGANFYVLKLSGSLFVLTVGPFVTYSTLTWCCAAVPVIFAVVFYFMPESPYYLIRKGDFAEAEKNLRRLCETNIGEDKLKTLLHEIHGQIENDKKNNGRILELIMSHENRKILLILLGIKTVQQFGGINAIDSYMQTIIQSSNSVISPEVSSIICGVVQIPAAIIAMVLVDRTGRKLLFITSALACATALISEGIYFYIEKELNGNVSDIRWLPTTGLMFYLVMNSIGLNTVPYILMSELFATNIKAPALVISMAYGATIAFLATKFFMPISEAWGMHTMFWIFAGFCILGSVYTYFVLPETKGKTFSQIQESFKSKQ